jgi:uncharacterized protein (DUF433 family)
MATVNLQTDPIPLTEDSTGTLRVANSRVPVDLVISAFEDGATPEAIVDSYDTLRLADVYAVIAYYLRHRQELSEYMQRRERIAADVRAKIEAAQGDMAELRSRIQARRSAQE